ncbi:hypothetical protein PG997_008240 [Apiospora hydei]|uniref:Uncharacterized protein n=1 Tax=Apiospora hydei TaxID=1337664 RepID=A0ABR1WBM4_9PEZI
MSSFQRSNVQKIPLTISVKSQFLGRRDVKGQVVRQEARAARMMARKQERQSWQNWVADPAT